MLAVGAHALQARVEVLAAHGALVDVAVRVRVGAVSAAVAAGRDDDAVLERARQPPARLGRQTRVRPGARAVGEAEDAEVDCVPHVVCVRKQSASLWKT